MGSATIGIEAIVVVACGVAVELARGAVVEVYKTAYGLNVGIGVGPAVVERGMGVGAWVGATLLRGTVGEGVGELVDTVTQLPGTGMLDASEAVSTPSMTHISGMVCLSRPSTTRWCLGISALA